MMMICVEVAVSTLFVEGRITENQESRIRYCRKALWFQIYKFILMIFLLIILISTTLFFDNVCFDDKGYSRGLSTKIFTIAVWFKNKEIIYISRLLSTMISIFPHWNITILIDIIRRRYHNFFDYCLCDLSIGRVRKNEEGISFWDILVEW